MKSLAKFWLGIFTFLPIIIMIVFFGLFFTVFLQQAIEFDNSYHDEFPIDFIQSIAGIIILIIVMALISLGVRIFYIVHSVNNPKNDTGQKIMWILLLVFIGTIGAVVYYFVEILPSKPEETLST